MPKEMQCLNSRVVCESIICQFESQNVMEEGEVTWIQEIYG